MAEAAGGAVDAVRAQLGLTTRGPYARLVAERVAGVLARHGVADHLGAALVEQDSALRQELVEAVVVPESHFFREPARLRHLVTDAVPAVLALRPPGHELRVWSAGCSTGEEAYSLAILLRQAGRATAPVLATDISRAALTCAAEGVYGTWSFRGVPPQVRGRHFQASGRGFRVRPAIRERVTFQLLNLVTDPFPEQMDLIVCRNVLVYLDPAVQRTVTRRFAAALSPGGWLMTAVTDPVLEESLGLEPARTPAGVLYRRAAPSTAGSQVAAPSRAAPHSGGAVGQQDRPRGVVRGSRLRAEPRAPTALAGRDPDPRPEPAAELGDVRRLLRHRALEDAEQLVHEVVRTWPLEIEPRYLQALVAMERGRPDQALPAATAASYLGPGLPAVHVLLGHVHLALGDHARASRSWDHARELLRLVDPRGAVALSDDDSAGDLLAMLDAAAAAAVPVRGGQR